MPQKNAAEYCLVQVDDFEEARSSSSSSSSNSRSSSSSTQKSKRKSSKTTSEAIYACIAAISPMIVLGSHPTAAACLHVLLVPITTNALVCFSRGRNKKGNAAPVIICVTCMFMGSLCAILILLESSYYYNSCDASLPQKAKQQQKTQRACLFAAAEEDGNTCADIVQMNHSTVYDVSSWWNNNNNDGVDHNTNQRKLSFIAHFALATTLVLGCCQLLYLIHLHKANVLRIMACTATAVIVVALSAAAVVMPIKIARRLFQSAALPFLFLFYETWKITTATAAIPAAAAAAATPKQKKKKKKTRQNSSSKEKPSSLSGNEETDVVQTEALKPSEPKSLNYPVCVPLHRNPNSQKDPSFITWAPLFPMHQQPKAAKFKF